MGTKKNVNPQRKSNPHLLITRGHSMGRDWGLMGAGNPKIFDRQVWSVALTGMFG